MAWMHLIPRGAFAVPPSIEMKARLSGAHPGNTLFNYVTIKAITHGISTNAPQQKDSKRIWKGLHDASHYFTSGTSYGIIRRLYLDKWAMVWIFNMLGSVTAVQLRGNMSIYF